MLDHILVIWDSSEAGEHILAHAIAVSKLVGAQLTLLRLLDEPTLSPQAQIIDPLNWHLAVTEVEAELDKKVGQLQAEGVNADKAILESTRPEQLSQYAHEQNVDLIVVANPGDNISAALHRMMATTDIPLLIIRPDQGPASADAITYKKMLVPLDGSQRAECALPMATQLARIAQAQLLLAHVVRKPEMPRRAPLTQEDTDLAERLVDRNKAEAEKYLEQLKGRLGENTQSHLLVNQNIAGTLHQLAESEGVDLILLCAHGYSAEPNWPYGSITGSFIAYSHKPILVVQDVPAAYALPPQAEMVQGRGR